MNNLGKVICIGDIILDTYCIGDIDRISPEAPIPVLKQTKKLKQNLGGSGNVARNIVATSTKCHLISLVGNDNEAKIINKLCKNEKNLSFHLVIDKTRHTTNKIRFVSANQQILRVDKESTKLIEKSLELQVLNNFKKNIDNSNVVVISDYNKGMLSRNLVRKIISICKKKNKTTIIDPKKEDFSFYEGATIITPNLKELYAATKLFSNDEKKSINLLSQNLINKFNFRAVVTTKSADGITLVEKNKDPYHLPSNAKEVFDVSGAGDTVVSYIASELSNNKDLIKSIEIANRAAGIAVGKFGTVVVEKKEIHSSKNKCTDKVSSLSSILNTLKEKRAMRNVIGFTNGCFDILHQGHIDYLKKARSKCDYLILALNSDFSVRKLKGSSRPIINENERSFLLSNFEFVDKIILFDEQTPIKLIKKIKPNIIFKGDDYKKKDVVGFTEIKKWKGKIILIKCTEGLSTSSIIERIKNET